MSKLLYHELKARERLAAILDPGSFTEVLPPPERLMSTYLPELGIPVQFDDGIVIGRGCIGETKLFIAAQAGQFVGGSVGEVHSAKLTGLLKCSARDRIPCVLLIESGGVRLHEGSSGEIGIAEAIRAVFDCRAVGATTIAVVGSDIGAYGGMGILASCCDFRVMTEHGRLGVSGPIVIEKWMGKEAYDSSNRALVWKTSGGKTRFLLGDAEELVDDDAQSVRGGISKLLQKASTVDLGTIKNRQTVLSNRLKRFGQSADAEGIWNTLGISDLREADLATASEFIHLLPSRNHE